jgi:hypothetical protein
MRPKAAFWLAWGVIAAITVLDGGYAISHSGSFADWEANPVAIAIASACGVYATVAARVATVLCGLTLTSAARPIVRAPATLVTLVAHLCLLWCYVAMLAT